MGIRIDYYGSGLSNGRLIKFHWISTAANVPAQLDHIKRRLNISGNIAYHSMYNPSKDFDLIELGELGSNL